MTVSGLKKLGIPLAVTALTLFVAGCSGGGGATSSTGSITPGAPVGPAAVEISLAAASATGSTAVPVTVAGPSTVPTPDPLYKWPDEIREPSPEIAHVYMEVVKISLMPAAEPFESEDMDGEFQDANSIDPASFPEKPHFITVVPDPPVRIDLLNLENGKPLARLLNRFDSVPTGTYDKIRVYYRNVKVVLADEQGELPPHGELQVRHPLPAGARAGHPSTSDTTQTGRLGQVLPGEARRRRSQDPDRQPGEELEGVQGHPPAADLRGVRAADPLQRRGDSEDVAQTRHCPVIRNIQRIVRHGDG